MMTQTTDRYAKVLYQLEIPQEIICETSRIFQEAPELIAVFENPVIPKKQKHLVLKKIFPVEIQNFLKV
ncbi:MAG: F0F1 ATP synthase subunit delta, partial [Lachnospiraceae bacterium]